jgi:hypothetical protein
VGFILRLETLPLANKRTYNETLYRIFGKCGSCCCITPKTVTQQPVDLVPIDPIVLVVGYLTSRVVGSSILNELNKDVGTIDDLIGTSNRKSPFAALSIEGFLGVGVKYVAVPFSEIEVRSNEDGSAWAPRTRSGLFRSSTITLSIERLIASYLI